MEGAEIYWYTGTLTNELISMSWQSYINATIDVFFFFLTKEILASFWSHNYTVKPWTWLASICPFSLVIVSDHLMGTVGQNASGIKGF